MIVDSYPIIRRAMRLKLEAAGHEVVGKVDNGLDALTMSRDMHPDLAIIDLAIPQLGGLDLIRRLKGHDGNLKVLVYTAGDTPQLAARCLQAGADGYVSKQDDLLELRSAVRAVLQGRSYFPREALEVLELSHGEAEAGEERQPLSAREFTVLQYLVKGMSNQAIAEEMAISFKTVSTYKTRLMHKLHAGSLVELAQIARSSGLLLNEGNAAPLPVMPVAEEDSLLRSMLDSMPAQMYVCDLDGRLLFANQTFCESLKQPFERLRGRRLDELGWLDEHDAAAFKTRFTLSLCRGEACSLDLPQHVQGQRRMMQHWGVPYRNDQGALVGMICGALDITEREEELLQYSDACLQAEAARRVRNHFLERMGRELQSPLSVVSSMLRLALQDMELGPRAGEALRVASQAVAELLRLGSDLSDLARLEMGRLSLDEQPVDVSALVAACIGRHADRARQRNLELDYRPEFTLPVQVWVDPKRFEQILDNLLDNALKFTDYGRVEVRLQAVPCGHANVELSLQISDSGIGMTEDEIPLLVQPFGLGLDPQRIGRSGTGLGLALSRSLAQAMGGTLELQSQSGLGTCATLNLCLPQAVRLGKPNAVRQAKPDGAQVEGRLSSPVLQQLAKPEPPPIEYHI
nr:ATP-binding protein [Pseudomonas insulae]